MTLVLRIESTDLDNPGISLRDGWLRTDDSVSIGRAADRGLVLEDPANTISKRHCVIERGESGFSVVDTSRNGTFLNDAPSPLPRDTPTLLHSGDVLRIGTFRLHIVAADMQPGRAGRAESATGVAALMPVEEAALLGPVVPRATADALLARFDSQAGREPLERQILEAETFEPISIRLSDPAAPGSIRTVDVDLFAEPHLAAAYADAVPEPRMAFVQPRVRIEPIPADWDLMEEIGRRQTPLAVPIETSPPEEVPVIAAAAPTVAPAPTGGAPNHSAALDAFFRGCGLAAGDLGAGDLVVIMERAGAMLRTSVENLQALLEVRQEARRAPSSERTMIGRTGNNPLKFIPDSRDALTAMLLANIPGFLAAEAAVAQAFADVRSHQETQATEARDAVLDLCERFAPETIEAKTLPAGGMAEWLKDRLMLERTAARLWRSYRATFDTVVAELDDDRAGGSAPLALTHLGAGGARHPDGRPGDAHGAVTACRRRLGEDLVRC